MSRWISFFSKDVPALSSIPLFVCPVLQSLDLKVRLHPAIVLVLG